MGKFKIGELVSTVTDTNKLPAGYAYPTKRTTRGPFKVVDDRNPDHSRVHLSKEIDWWILDQHLEAFVGASEIKKASRKKTKALKDEYAELANLGSKL